MEIYKNQLENPLSFKILSTLSELLMYIHIPKFNYPFILH